MRKLKCKICKTATNYCGFSGLRYCPTKTCSMYLKSIEKQIILRKKKVVKIVIIKTKFSDKHPELYDKALIKKLKHKLIKIYSKKCMKCGSTKERIVVEHIVSRFLGGTNEISNLQLLCWKCNFQKGLKIIDYRPKQ